MAIYLMMDREYVKVGYAKDVKQRMGGYRTHNPHCVCVDSFDGGTMRDEEIIHHLMSKDHRFERHNSTEWYLIKDDELLEKLQAEKLSFFLKMIGIERDEEVGIVHAEVMRAYARRTPLAQYVLDECDRKAREIRESNPNALYFTIQLDGEVDRLSRGLSRGETCKVACRLLEEQGYKCSIYSTNRKIQVRWF